MNPDATMHRGWTIEENWLGMWEATGPNFDASYEGEEDGWVGNGEFVTGTTREDVIGQVDDWFDENTDPRLSQPRTE